MMSLVQEAVLGQRAMQNWQRPQGGDRLVKAAETYRPCRREAQVDKDQIRMPKGKKR